MDRPRLLIVDDEKLLLTSLRYSLEDRYEICEATSVLAGIAAVEASNFDVIITDLYFEGQDLDGLAFIDWLNQKGKSIPVIVLSADHCTRRVSEAMRRRIFQFIPKESDLEQIRKEIERALLEKTLRRTTKPTFQTKSPKMIKLIQEIEKVVQSGSQAPILLIGETGTGKEVVTQFIANTAKKRLVTANMSGINPQTAISELFGHRKGSFTGASDNKVGLITQAHDGIFFLDELGECSPTVQAMLLRVIQHKELLPLGSLRPLTIDVQFIGATNRNLLRMMEQGLFREDLYQRLSTFVFNIPKLSERPEDIVYYTDLFLNKYSLPEHGPKHSLSPAAYDVFLEYDWPGNVRELENVIQRLCVLNETTVCSAQQMNDMLRDRRLEAGSSSQWIRHNGENSYLARSTVIPDLSLVKEALIKSKGNRKEAAKLLGIGRTTLYRILPKLKEAENHLSSNWRGA